MSARRSFRRRLRYKFDTVLARGTIAVILWLGLITGAVVLVTGTLLSVLEIAVHGHQVGIVEGVWQNLLRSFEPAAMEADTGWPLRLQSLFVVLFGILVGSSLIGLIASGIERRVEELRKGRSEVIEENHVLILGWSEKIFPVIAELVLAHRGRRDSVIVVLADHDKIEMEDAIRARVPHLGHTRVVCRRGDPSNPADLALVSPYESRSVIALGNNHMDGDAQVIRSVLALMDDDRFTSLRIVADCALPENADALREATAGHAIAIASSDLIARVTAQACRHTGLGTVFEEILDFGDVDIYFHAEPGLAGRRFGDLVLCYEQGAPIGIRYPDGVVDLNPPDDHVMAAGDSVVLVSDGIESIVLKPEPVEPALPSPTVGAASQATCTNLLLVGWNPLAPRILRELDKWAMPGSRIRILVDGTLVSEEEVAVPGLGNLEISVTSTYTSSPHKVAELCFAEDFERVVVLCYRSALTAEEADARALMTLLQLRQFRQDHPERGDGMSVLTEVLDIRDVKLARVAGAEDFIVSERITALMLAQLAEVPDREKVFADLFETSGSEVCMRPVSDYAHPQPDTPFGAYVAGAHRRGHLVIGYRSTGLRGKELASAIHLDPRKSALVDLKPEDRLIVVVSRRGDAALAAATMTSANEANPAAKL
jgi:voltage-gated potassium channel Kch